MDPTGLFFDVIRWLTYGAIVLGFLAVLVMFAVRVYFNGRSKEMMQKGLAKAPTVIRYLIGYADDLEEVPKWFVRIFIINPAKLVETFQDVIISTLSKLRSRIYQVLLLTFGLTAYAIDKIAKTGDGASWQGLGGVAAIITAMAFIIKPFIDARNHEMNMKAGGLDLKDGSEGPPAPELGEPAVQRKKKR